MKWNRVTLSNITAFLTTMGIITTFTYMRGENHRAHEISQPVSANYVEGTDQNTNIYVRRLRRHLLKHSVRDNQLVDAKWTVEPNAQQNMDRPFDKQHKALKVKSLDMGAEQTTPVVTDAPTIPLTTQSDTTPIYTASQTSPLTTESITTPIVTLPGNKDISTDQDPTIVLT